MRPSFIMSILFVYHFKKCLSKIALFKRSGSQHFSSIKFIHEWYDWASTTLLDKIYLDNITHIQVKLTYLLINFIKRLDLVF